MIAKLENKSFKQDVFDRKVDYHQKKIDDNKAELLYSSFLAGNLKDFKQDCNMVLSRNSRVELPYNEVSLNLPVGEKISDELFLTIANDYMQQLGYKDASYAVIKHKDKDHNHLHILFTTMDKRGMKIPDSFLRLKSLTISRELEKKYTLQTTVYNKFNNKSLNEIKAREYYFHNALTKGLKSYSAKAELERIIQQEFPTIDFHTPKINLEYEMLLGNHYESIGALLEKGNFFNPLYKDELLKAMDDAHLKSVSISDFKNNLESAGYYMRFVTDKGISRYIYGVPDAALYFKDSSLPQKYRYGQLSLEQDSIVSPDVQKHYIYNQVFIALHDAMNYNDFKERVDRVGISIIESSNSGGVYGLSFMMQDTEPSIIFKASEISRRLSYNKISEIFVGSPTPTPNFEIQEITDNKEIIQEMKNNIIEHFPDFSRNYFEKEGEDNLTRKKKRKNNKYNREL